MTPVRFAARSMLGWTFVHAGVSALRAPDGQAETVRPLLERLSARYPALPKDPTTLIRAVGAVQIAAGVALGTGRAPRLAATVLAGTIVASGGLLRHPDGWGPAERNLALLGGLTLAAVDTEGRPSLTWRARRAARSARSAAESAAHTAREKLPR